MRITIDDTRSAIARLSVAYRPPDAPESLALMWVDALVGIEPEELLDAIGEQLKTEDKFFPQAGALRAFALAARSSGSTQQASWDQRQEGPCPCCGAELRPLTSEEQGLASGPKRYGVLHDRSLHERNGVPIYGHAR